MQCFSWEILTFCHKALVDPAVSLVCGFIRRDNPRRGASCLETFMEEKIPQMTFGEIRPLEGEYLDKQSEYRKSRHTFVD